MIRLALILGASIACARAGAACVWTVESQDEFFSQNFQYMQKPKIESAACSPRTAPICTGFVTCVVAGQPKGAQATACKSVQVNGKWRCPKADICFNDASIQMNEMPPPQPPAPAAAPPAETPPAETTE